MNGEFSEFSQTMPQSNITVRCSKFGEFPQRLFNLFLDYKSSHISGGEGKQKVRGVG